MIIGTRDSRLAIAQTDLFIRAMRIAHPEISTDVVEIKTSGDLDLTSNLDELNGYGAFVRELDSALISGSIDVSVNSMKDVPILRNDDVSIPAVLPRASVEDVMLPIPLEELHEGAMVGSSSVRRTAFLRQLRPDVRVVPLRGNVNTRLEKLDSGEYDAIILAKAGLERLGIEREMHIIDTDIMVPAPAQGAIAIACRSGDMAVMRILSDVNHKDTFDEVTLERKIMRAMGAGCSSPVGIYAKRTDGGFRLKAMHSMSGTILRSFRTLPANYSESDVEKVAEELGGRT